MGRTIINHLQQILRLIFPDPAAWIGTFTGASSQMEWDQLLDVQDGVGADRHRE